MSLPLETNSATTPYRAMCLWAVMSVVAGALSIPILVFWFSWFWAVVPLTGIGLGWRALGQIRQAPNEWTGLRLAQFGIGLSLGLWVVGYGWLVLAGVRDVPYGYELIAYDKLQPDPNAPADPIPQSALDLQDKRVFLKGFMRPGRRQTGIREFVLVPVNGECPFCIPNPKQTEMVRIVLQGDLETIYTTHQIGVGGRFQVDPADPSRIPYCVDADYIR
jgi:hypothetical protein